MMEKMIFYRYEAEQFSNLSGDDEFLSLFSLHLKLTLKTYNLHKETSKGYWIGYGHPYNGLQSHSRWVSKTSKKRYAYPTKEMALINYIKRTKRRISILKHQIKSSEDGLRLAIKKQNNE